MTAPPSDLRPVAIRNLPVRLHGRAREHHAEVMREFALMELSEADVPTRMLELYERLRAQYAAETAGPELKLEEALARGDISIDLDYVLPAGASLAVVALSEVLDETDEYCRRGEHLLTLASDPELVAYRRWYFDEFLRQLAGGPPRPWDGPMT